MQFNYRCSDCGQNFSIEPQITVCLTCGKQQAPDYIFVSTGDGCILSGVYKGS